MISILTVSQRLRPLAILAIAILMSSCGGSSDAGPGGDSTPVTPVTSVTLQSVSVTPSPFITGVGVARRLTATGTFSDGSTADLGANAVWTSLTPSVATVSAGLVTGVALGPATISVSSAGVSASIVVNVTTNTWAPAGTMLQPVSSFTMTMLTSGKVLSSGSDGLSSDAEIYDPDKDAWSATEAQRFGRIGQTATLLLNGKVLVAGGGDHRQSLPDSVTYDPTSNSWSTMLVSMLSGRIGHTATLLPNGNVLVAGGATFPLSTTPSEELYDPTANAWSAAAVMTSARTWHTATLLPNGKVFVVGGYASLNNTVSSAETYDPGSNTWTAAANMAIARNQHTATLLPNGKVLVTGGQSTTGNPYAPLSSAEIYDPNTDAWSSAGNMASPRTKHAAIVLPNGKVLVFGGSATLNGSLASAEIYDPAANSWSPAASMATPRSAPMAVLLKNGATLVCGETTGAGTSCELYW